MNYLILSNEEALFKIPDLTIKIKKIVFDYDNFKSFGQTHTHSHR